jgi:cytochrome P450
LVSTKSNKNKETSEILTLPGQGKRRCIGENLAKSSLFLFFTSLLHVFNIEPVGELPDLKGKDGITLSPHPFSAKFTRKRFFEQNY